MTTRTIYIYSAAALTWLSADSGSDSAPLSLSQSPAGWSLQPIAGDGLQCYIMNTEGTSSQYGQYLKANPQGTSTERLEWTQDPGAYTTWNLVPIDGMTSTYGIQWMGADGAGSDDYIIMKDSTSPVLKEGVSTPSSGPETFLILQNLDEDAWAS